MAGLSLRVWYSLDYIEIYRSLKTYVTLRVMVYWSQGCRSFLTPDNENQFEGLCNKGNIANAKNYHEGDHKYYGRLIAWLSWP